MKIKKNKLKKYRKVKIITKIKKSKKAKILIELKKTRTPKIKKYSKKIKIIKKKTKIKKTKTKKTKIKKTKTKKQVVKKTKTKKNRIDFKTRETILKIIRLQDKLNFNIKFSFNLDKFILSFFQSIANTIDNVKIILAEKKKEKNS